MLHKRRLFYNMSSILDYVEKAYGSIASCHDVVRTVYEVEKAVTECGCASTLAKMEQAVLNTAAADDVIQQLVYVTVLQSGSNVLVR